MEREKEFSGGVTLSCTSTRIIRRVLFGCPPHRRCLFEAHLSAYRARGLVSELITQSVTFHSQCSHVQVVRTYYYMHVA